MNYKAMAHINSLKGEMAEITVLDTFGETLLRRLSASYGR